MAVKKGSAEHQARNDAFGNKEKGQRNYGTTGDRPTKANYSEAYAVGQKFGLHPKSPNSKK
jgi:hypothetical protein